MRQYSGGLVALMGTIIVFLLVILTIQTSYLVWLHRELYRTVAGTSGGLGDVSKLLSMDVNDLASPQGSGTGLPADDHQGRDARKEPGANDHLQRIDGQLNTLLGDALSDPAVKDLLRDLDLEASPAPAPQTQAPAATPPAFTPQFDFREEGEDYVVTVELPGVKESEARVSLDGGTVTVSGTRNGGPFAESLALPGPIDPATQRVEFKDGRVTVRVRKATG